MTKVQYRSIARQHLDKAKRLLMSEDSSDVRYACLELRFAIEAIVYDTLQAYVKHYGNALMESWQPQKILKELVKLDPYAATSGTMQFKVDDAPDSEYKSVGSERRFSLQWADKTYNTLGNFLHMPTISQHVQGRSIDSHTMKSRAEDAMNEIDKSLSANLFNTVFTQTYHVDCTCDFKVLHKASPAAATSEAECPSCGRLYDVRNEGGQKFGYRESTVNVKCPLCGETSVANAKLKRAGAQFKCPKCETEFKVEIRFGLVPTRGSTPAG